MKKQFVFVVICYIMTMTVTVATAQKKPLDHSVYDKWSTIGGHAITNDGKYASYYSSKEEADGSLNIINLKDNSIKSIDRGTKAKFTNNCKLVIYTIRPFIQQTKEAKFKKYKGEKTPKDSLGIMNLETGNVKKYPFLKSYILPKDNGNYIVFEARITENESKDNGLFIYDITTQTIIDTLKNVDSYIFNDSGTKLYCVKKIKGKGKKGYNGIFVYSPIQKSIKTIIEGSYKTVVTKPILSEDNTMLAFYANMDTTKKIEDNVEIYTYKDGDSKPKLVVSNSIAGLQNGWQISNKRALHFNKDNSRLFFAVAPIRPQKDTTLIESECAKLDVWSYNDKYIQPRQLNMVNQDLNKSYLSWISLNNSSGENNIANNRMIQLATPDCKIVTVPQKWNSNWAYSLSNERYAVESQWDANPINDLYIISLKDGSSKLLLKGEYIYSLKDSPDGKYLIWYNPVKKNWFSYDIEEGKIRNITEKINVPLWNELHDTPQMAGPYGSAGWRKNDKAVFIYDKYDVWEVDPKGINNPIMLTKGEGRAKSYTFKIIRIDQIQLPDGTPGIKQDPIGEKDDIYFTAFDNKSKGFGYYTMQYKNKKYLPLKKLIMEPNYSLGYFNKAKNSNVITFVKSNFVCSPNIWVTKDMFKSAIQVTNSNPQQKDYNWGTCELVYWKGRDGRDIEGLLHKPEDFDSSKKYPMIVYFYEKTSKYKNMYRKPALSKSTINVTYFTSNGYLVFMPDIYYTAGNPGQNAMDCIIPGVEKLCENSWVDKDNIAIQGQSWGGYQVAYMVTQTDMFKCAGAGAPVANMTSAYGGIRWGQGVVRQFQYEHTQSRIGKTLWEEGGLDLYIKNSPLFFADKVNTPLLIMCNDKDEAVPWYQGIEFFTALRRLGKQNVWMLQYNKESHNISGTANARDYTIRLSQFMDHYLKGAPMPVWMKYGVPATKKGIDWGLDLVE
ncbi:MAG: prolyl oligopeptidase family serine peptidase [Bacteroidales bacterium]